MSEREESIDPEDIEIQTDVDPKAKHKPRITVVETLYHQLPGEEPTEISHKFSREIDSEEEPYQRRKKLGESWRKLDVGWLATNAGMVVIRNEAGTRLTQVPTECEKEAIKKQVIRIRFKEDQTYPDIEVFPGESFRFRPYAPETVSLQCASGEVRYSLFITPR